MTELLIWSNYLVASAFALWRLTCIDLKRMTFADGLLIGCIYYFVVPMLFILLDGQLSAQFVRTNDYFPFRDQETTLTIIICLYFIPLLHVLFPEAPAPAPERAAPQADVLRFNRLLMILLLASYFISTAWSFWLSGLWAGGHWHSNARDVLANSGLALVLRHVASFSRTAIFAVLLYQATTGVLSQRAMLLLGAAVVICDMLLTFNRITAAYFLISVLLLNRKRWLISASLVVVLLFFLPIISNMWPVFRGLATRDGYTLQGMISAAEIAYRTATTYPGMADFTSGVFESINIPVLNFIVHNQGHTLHVDPGSIYLRPATIFLPRIVWEDRPEVYGTLLGALINAGSNGLALNSTLIGEPYGNFGAWWPLGVLPLYFIYHLLFLQLGKTTPAFGAVGAFCAIAMWRFDSTVVPIALVLCVAMLWAVRVWISLRTPRPLNHAWNSSTYEPGR